MLFPPRLYRISIISLPFPRLNDYRLLMRRDKYAVGDPRRHIHILDHRPGPIKIGKIPSLKILRIGMEVFFYPGAKPLLVQARFIFRHRRATGHDQKD